MPSKQETFDTVVAHLRKQGAKATVRGENGSDECTYRSPDGRQCAAGCLIPDELYDPRIEGKPAHNELVANILKSLGHDVRLCLSLQRVHDDCEPKNWEDGFQRVAMDYALTYTPPEEIRLTTPALSE